MTLFTNYHGSQQVKVRTQATHILILHTDQIPTSQTQLSIKHITNFYKFTLFQKKPTCSASTALIPSSRTGLGILATNWFLFNWKEYKQHRTNELTSSASHNDKTENNDHQVNMVMISSEQWIMI